MTVQSMDFHDLTHLCEYPLIFVVYAVKQVALYRYVSTNHEFLTFSS